MTTDFVPSPKRLEETQFRLNGATISVEADPDEPVLSVLRNQLGLKGSRYGCGSGLCGACSILVDGRAVTSCDLPLWAVEAKEVTTVEGLGRPANPHPLQRAFIEEQAMQCGYCVSGILITSAALLSENAHPTEPDVRRALDRNLCRCGAHNRMVRAVMRAASEGSAK